MEDNNKDKNNNGIPDKYESLPYLVSVFTPILLIFMSCFFVLLSLIIHLDSETAIWIRTFSTALMSTGTGMSRPDARKSKRRSDD